MEYRDERRSVERRIETLERELTEAKETIARLEGRVRSAEGVNEGHDWVTGAPSGLVIDHELPFAVSTAGLEAIADLLRARMPTGQLSSVGRTVSYRSASADLRVAATDDGRTTLHVTASHGHRRIGLLAGMPGLALLAGIFSAAPFVSLGAPTAVTVVAVVLGILATWAWLRSRIRHGILEENALLRGVTEAALALAREHRSPERGSARIDTSALDDDELTAREQELAMSEDERAAEELATARATAGEEAERSR